MWPDLFFRLVPPAIRLLAFFDHVPVARVSSRELLTSTIAGRMLWSPGFPGLTWRCLQPHHNLVCSPFQERAEVTLRMSLGKVSLVGCSWSAAQLWVIPRDSNCIILEAGHVQPCLIFWSVFFKWDFLCSTLYNVRVVMCWASVFLGTFLALWNGLIANSATWRPALSHFHHSIL